MKQQNLAGYDDDIAYYSIVKANRKSNTNDMNLIQFSIVVINFTTESCIPMGPEIFRFHIFDVALNRLEFQTRFLPKLSISEAAVI